MITLNEALGNAQRNRIAIGHFNVSDLVGLKAVTGPAQTLKVPVLVGTSEGERSFLGVTPITLILWIVPSKLRKHDDSLPAARLHPTGALCLFGDAAAAPIG